MFKENLLKDALRFYAGQHVLDRVLDKGPAALLMDHEARTMTMLWIDVRGFTKVDESLSPEMLYAAIGEHQQRVFACIGRHGGTVDSLVGDATLATWDKAASADYAKLALQCAEELVRVTDPAQFGIKVNIGLHTGRVLLGNIGTPARARFTVLGDAVNLASRLCSRCPGFGVSTLFTEATLQASGNAMPARELETIRVKGMDDPVRLFTLESTAQPA